MFVRKIKHANGKIYIQVIEKLQGKYIVKKSFGSANTTQELKSLICKADKWIKNSKGIQEFDFNNERELFKLALSSITSHKLVGIDLVLGKIFDDIGFNRIDDELFRDLVLYRLVYPKSKLKTAEYLLRYAQKNYSEDEIYRYMDKLRNIRQELVQRISYEHTLKILPNGIQVVFYDVTTIYFETDYEDDLRKPGFSKEGRHQNPQIVLGLLVSEGGYPLAYDIFENSNITGECRGVYVDLDQLYRTSDYISIHLPHNKQTVGFISSEQIKLMKSTAILINVARGGIVDENDLYEALRNKVIAGAGLDVYTHEPPIDKKILQLDNIITTSHIGGSTKEAVKNIGDVTVDNVCGVLLNGERAKHCVNPEIYN